METRGLEAAKEAFDFSIWSYRVAIVGAEMTATAELSAIQAIIQAKRDFAPADQGALEEAAREIQGRAQTERKGKFQTYRQSALVNSCAALENLWKVAFVESVLECPQILGKVGTKITLLAEDVIGVSDRDKLFALSEEMYRDPTAKQKKSLSHFEKHRYLALDLRSPSAASKNEIEKVLADVRPDLFNEAFTVRNCFVHQGGVADDRVSKGGRFRTGEQMALSPSLMDEYLAPMRIVAGLLAHGLWI